MKAIVGKKYKLIASPEMFADWIGSIFIVTNISKTEVTLESENCSQYGCAFISVSQEEFPEYFEMVTMKPEKHTENKMPVKPIKKTRAGKWSEWHHIKLYGVTYAYKENGKDVVVRSGGYRGRSKCHPEDEFNLEYGLRMAISRLVKNKTQDKKQTIGEKTTSAVKNNRLYDILDELIGW